jgi:hypothetical protein
MFVGSPEEESCHDEVGIFLLFIPNFMLLLISDTIVYLYYKMYIGFIHMHVVASSCMSHMPEPCSSSSETRHHVLTAKSRTLLVGHFSLLHTCARATP